jgi:hypothetical protein
MRRTFSDVLSRIPLEAQEKSLPPHPDAKEGLSLSAHAPRTDSLKSGRLPGGSRIRILIPVPLTPSASALAPPTAKPAIVIAHKFVWIAREILRDARMMLQIGLQTTMLLEKARIVYQVRISPQSPSQPWMSAQVIAKTVPVGTIGAVGVGSG